MAKLTAGERANLPDSAFAYIDANGKRRLPINDEPHVRNALSRFDQVVFEDAAARERARTRLLNAAKRYGIVPVGFITGQIESERQRTGGGPDLPSGTVTLLFTDIEGSTGLLDRLGKGYAAVLHDAQHHIAKAVADAGGREVEVRADEYFAVFEEVLPAIDAAVAFQGALARHPWPEDGEVKVRTGIHTGDIEMTRSGYVGLPVNEGSRLCAAAHGGQTLVSGTTLEAAEYAEHGILFRGLGSHQLRGLPAPTEIYQVETGGSVTDFPPLRLSASPVPGEAAGPSAGP
jgi:class 3 adenylate cyclase